MIIAENNSFPLSVVDVEIEEYSLNALLEKIDGIQRRFDKDKTIINFDIKLKHRDADSAENRIKCIREETDKWRLI